VTDRPDDQQLRSRTQAAAPAPLHGTEDAAGAAVAPATATTPLAALLSRHLLQEREVLQLLLKPSQWFIVTSSLRFAAIVLIAVIAAQLLEDRLNYNYSARGYAELATFLIAGRVMWATLQWMGRLYLLTDLRILRLGGVFRIDIVACPLRKVARTRLTRTMRERLLHLGSIEILPQTDTDESLPDFAWQTIARPVQVQEQIVAAINRAKHPGRGCP
jgi:hypothetical protein